MPAALSDSLPSGSASTPPTSSFRLTHLRWLICGVLFFGSVINYIDRGTISILSHHVQKIFSMSQSDYGWIIFSFQLSYAIMMLAFGWIIDRLGTRKGFALAMAWWSLAAMGQAMARWRSLLCRGVRLTGNGRGGEFPGIHQSRGRMVSQARACFGHGDFQLRHGGGGGNLLSPGRVVIPPLGLAEWPSSGRARWA